MFICIYLPIMAFLFGTLRRYWQSWWTSECYNKLVYRSSIHLTYCVYFVALKKEPFPQWIWTMLSPTLWQTQNDFTSIGYESVVQSSLTWKLTRLCQEFMCRQCKTGFSSYWLPIKTLNRAIRVTNPPRVCFCYRWSTVSIQRTRKARRSRWKSSTVTPSVKWRRKSWTPSTRTFLTPTDWRPLTWIWVKKKSQAQSKQNKQAHF